MQRQRLAHDITCIEQRYPITKFGYILNSNWLTSCNRGLISCLLPNNYLTNLQHILIGRLMFLFSCYIVQDNAKSKALSAI